MGSDLYVSVECSYPADDGPRWWSMFEGGSTDLARGIVVDAFGDSYSERVEGDGYLRDDERAVERARPDCPWRDDAPYWIRLLDGQVFSNIVREKRWQKLQDGDFTRLECKAELRAVAAMVDSLLRDGLLVRVWCWHSQ